jgi:trehalose 6-phosphate phosphatase
VTLGSLTAIFLNLFRWLHGWRCHRPTAVHRRRSNCAISAKLDDRDVNRSPGDALNLTAGLFLSAPLHRVSSGRYAMSPRRSPPKLTLTAALFLDLDGTLAPLAPTPDAVPFDAHRAQVLTRLEAAMGGALAVISGRTVHDVRRILGPAPGAVAAVHGLVRCWPDGAVVQAPPGPGLAIARAALEDFVRQTTGLILEDKTLSLALHYRRAPDLKPAVVEIADRLAAETGLVRQDGVMVCELRSPGPNKGEALAAFMRTAPFAGRRPIMVGDDLTDEHGFEAAVADGGFGVLVGAPRPSAAAYRLEDADAVLDWLGEAVMTVAA